MFRTNILLFFFSIFLISCSSDDLERHELGKDLIENATSVHFIDTLTINTSTVILDSVITSSTGIVSVGRYTDPDLGNVSADAYTTIGLGSSFTLENSNGPVYDSLVFITYYQGKYVGDTTKFQTINIYRLAEDLYSQEDSIFFYNIDSFVDSVFIGAKTFAARPKRKQDNGDLYNLRIPLSDELGQELINLAIQKDTILSESDKWIDYFKGISLRAGDSDDAAILNFQARDTLMKIRLYYTEKTNDNVEPDEVQFHDFPVGSPIYAFSNYKSDRQGKLLENLVEQEFDISSEQTEGYTFIQGGVGLVTKLEIPYLTELNKLGVAGSFLKAELVLNTIPGKFNEAVLPLPEAFNLFIADSTNTILEGVIDPRTGNLLTSLFFDKDADGEDVDNPFFSFDITTHVNRVLNGNIENNALLVTLPFSVMGSSMDRMVLTNDETTNFEIKIKATYVVQK